MSSVYEKQPSVGNTNAATNSDWNDNKARLEEDIRTVIADAQALLNSARSQAETQTQAARDMIREQLTVLKDKTQRAQAAMRTRSQVAIKATDEYIHAKPWQAVGIAAAVGMFTGAILRSRGTRRGVQRV